MSKTYISAALRRQVIERAGNCCEYCLSDTKSRAIDFAIDHVIAEKHRWHHKHPAAQTCQH